MDAQRNSSSPGLGRQDCLLPLKLPIPARIPLLYVILGVLLTISVLPMYFYSAQIETMNRERLKTNEMLLQNTVTRSLADDISQHREALHMMLANLSSSIQVMMLANSNGSDPSTQKFLTPELQSFIFNPGDDAGQFKRKRPEHAKVSHARTARHARKLRLV